MPELPDVEAFGRHLSATALHKPIERAWVRDEYMTEGLSRRALQRRLEGRSLEGTHRHGKLLFVRLDDGNSLVLHFGMTGHPVAFEHAEDEPPHARLLLRFHDGSYLAMECQRRLGLLSWTDDEDEFLREKDVGPDALRASFEEFQHALAGRRGKAKSTLMNQSVLAGIGNLCADEILFGARVHPEARVNELSDRKRRTLYETTGPVLEMLIERCVHDTSLPDDTLLAHREPDGVCPQCGRGLARVKVSNRTTYFCSRCQRKP